MVKARMSDGESYIVKQRDLAEIIRLQDAGALEEFLDQPLTAIAEATTALLPAYFAPVGRIVQGALKGKIFKQVQREVHQLREKGRIPDDFAAKKYGFKSWVELLTTIDEDIPDEDRLEALKAMFYAVNKFNATDGERVASYQLFQMAKRLTSGQLLLLKVAHERAMEKAFKPEANLGARGWLEVASRRLGHEIVGLVEQDERVLIQNGLLTGRHLPDDSGINDGNGRLTPLAFKFCEMIQTYHRDLSESEERAAS
jgi:hypothetical protein